MPGYLFMLTRSHENSLLPLPAVARPPRCRPFAQTVNRPARLACPAAAALDRQARRAAATTVESAPTVRNVAIAGLVCKNRSALALLVLGDTNKTAWRVAAAAAAAIGRVTSTSIASPDAIQAGDPH